MIKAWVVNLESAVERRRRIGEQLQALGIAFELFPAVNGRALDAASVARMYDARAARADYREMSRGEIGCALSHVGIYRRMLDEGATHALVLEDDAALGPRLAEVLKRLEAAVPADEPVVVLLNHVDKYTRWGSEQLDGDTRLVRRYGDWWRAHGYLITRAAATRLLQAQDPVAAPADYWALFEKRGIVRLQAVVPYCIGLSELAGDSSLETHRAQQDAAHRARRSLGYYLHHYAWKRFAFQIFVRPFIRVARQRQTW